MAVIRAAGRHGSKPVNAELDSILKGTDPELRSAAVVALDSPGNTEVVAPSSTALNSTDSRTAMAAIRALGTIGASEARDVLQSAAESRADLAIRRRTQSGVPVARK